MNKRKQNSQTNPLDDDQTRKNHKQTGILLGIAFVVIILVFIGGYVYVARNYLGDKQNEIGIPGFIALLGFIAILVQIVVNFLQWSSTKQQAQLARNAIVQADKHFQLTQRPILVVDKVEGSIKAGENIRPVVSIVNKGLGTATDISIEMNLSKKGTYEFPFDATPQAIPFLTSQDSLKYCFNNRQSEKFDAEGIDLIDFNQIFVYGKGSYKDYMGNPYELERWAFVYTKEFEWINDYTILDNASEVHEKKEAEWAEIFGRPRPGSETLKSGHF